MVSLGQFAFLGQFLLEITYVTLTTVNTTMTKRLGLIPGALIKAVWTDFLVCF